MATTGPGEREPTSRGDVAPDATVRAPGPREERAARVVSGGSITEAVAGAGAVVLAILGLADILPGYMAAIATIAIGVALLAEGSAVAARWSRLMEEVSGSRARTRAESSGGVGAEIFGGIAGIVLGVLSLLGVLPMVLIPIALLVFGGSLLIGSSTAADLSAIGVAEELGDRRAQLAREATMAATGAHVLVGVAAIVLGIIALVGMSPLSVSLVGLLALGAAILFSGSAVTSRMLNVLRR